MLRYCVLVLAAFAFVHAQEMTEPEPEGEHHAEPEAEDGYHHDDMDSKPENRPRVCMSDDQCGMGMCHDGECRCPNNYYGTYCETHIPLKCYVCDGYASEASSCATGMGLSHDTDVQVCSQNQTHCRTEFWYDKDGVTWMKRHGCSTYCWNRADCSPYNSDSCISCCNYDYCIGYEKEMMAGGSDVITPSIVVVSIVSFLACLL